MSVTALKGGTPIRTKPVNTWPMHDDAEEKALLGVLRSGKWWYGERVKEFEEKYAAFQGAKHGISCTNGTSALWIALKALGIGSGDEVITTPWTFIATSTAVVLADAIPVFVDIELDTLNMNLDQVEAAITPKTKAILPVHFFGRPLDMDRLMAIAKKHNLAVIEDAAHAWGGRYKDRGLGCIGEVGTFSFQFSKNMTSAEGGIVLTNDKDLAVNCWSFMNCGRWPGKPWYHMENIAGNNRLTEFQAAVLLSQLERLEEQTLLRARNAALLNKGLADVAGLEPQPESNRITRRAYHLYCMRLDESEFGCNRESFVRAANAEGWPVTAGYPMPLYKQPVFQNLDSYDYASCHCPVTEDLCYKSGLWFPHQLLLGSEKDMQDILQIVRKIQASAEAL